MDPTVALKGALLKVEVTHRAAITDERKLEGWPRAALLLLASRMVRPGEVRHMRKSETCLLRQPQKRGRLQN
jgi:hypothetical protein